MGWSFLEKTIDPVCGKRINPVKAGIAAVHAGHSFFFLQSALLGFVSGGTDAIHRGGAISTERMVASLSAGLDKSTGGKPPCCH